MKKYAGIFLSAAILCGMCGCTYQAGYDHGYNAGYQEGVKGIPTGYGESSQDGEKSYQNGYDEGYNAGYQEGISKKRVLVKVYGDFTATVREITPDYVFDGETPHAAVVTLFQGSPFVIRLDEDICRKLEIGETYTFIVDEQESSLTSNEFDDKGNVRSDALTLGRFRATDFRTPADDEYGLECWRVYCSAE